MHIERRGTGIQFLGSFLSRGWKSEEEPTKETEGELPERKEENQVRMWSFGE